MGTVYGLIRVSDRKSDLSPAGQAEQIRKHAAFIGLADPVMRQEDLGTSGYFLNFYERPQGGWLMRHLHGGDTLIVAKLDRLGRKSADILYTVETLHKRGVRIYICQWGGTALDINTAAGKMILAMFSAFAEFEHDMTAERTAAGRAQAKIAGLSLGPPPRFRRAVPIEGTKRKRLEWNIELLDAFAELYRKKQAGGIGRREAIEWLNSRGILNGHGGPFTKLSYLETMQDFIRMGIYGKLPAAYLPPFANVAASRMKPERKPQVRRPHSERLRLKVKFAPPEYVPPKCRIGQDW